MTRTEAKQIIDNSRWPDDAKEAALKMFDERSQGIGLTLTAEKVKQEKRNKQS